MLALQPAAMHLAGVAGWLDADAIGASGRGWSLDPMQRTLSLTSGKDLLSGRVAAQHSVQLSASSDSALLEKAPRRRSHAINGRGADAASQPPRALLGATASGCLSSQLQQIHTWDRFDVFRVAELTQGRPLYTVAMAIFEALGLLSWKVDRRKVEAFLTAAEQAYGRGSGAGRNPYHNSTHAADVVQAAFIMLRSVQQPQFTKLEVFGLLLAAIVHDIAHTGVTNDFLAKTGDALALAHGCASVNEKHHLATAFSIASQEETNIFAGLTPAETAQVREFVRSAVLCTDMAQHSALSEQLAASRQRHAPPGAAQQAERQQQGGERKRHGQDHPLAGASTPPAAPAVSYSTSDRALLLRALLHMADLSNPARPLPLGASWGRLVSQEFLAQGDRERAMGLKVTPACDRETVVVSTSQLRFISMFLRPLLEQMRGVLGGGLHSQLLQQLAATEKYWRRHEARSQASAASRGT